ncbi:MAG: DUF2961 domain-containing protein [Pirellulaceae bacterium]
MRAEPQIALKLMVSVLVLLAAGSSRGDEPMSSGAQMSDHITIIKKDTSTGFSNAGWKYDRYQDLPSLDAHARMVVADLTGPGIIRHIHTTRHHPPEMTARGIVLEIYFDNAEEPAVACPLADFFGDGCNGKSMYFSTPWIECAPWSYNCYFPMPFAKHARVILRNDTDKDVMNYSYVEWEPLEKWSEQLGYFHATWRRQVFPLSKDTDIEFFHVQGSGHILGRQFSVATDEPLFRDFNVVMEGNNEIDIDGRQRAVDYLGTEDSFTFSWGFQQPFAGLRAGMPHVTTGSPALLSIYRFHDHQPVRFRQELTWCINWREERGFTASSAWSDRVAAGGCWVHYDTVFYWYQDHPAAYEHEPLPPLEERQRALAHTSRVIAGLDDLVAEAPVDVSLENNFDTADDEKRVTVVGCYVGTHPFWIDTPAATGGHPGNPNPGRRGILAIHPQDEAVPAIVVRKVAIPREPAKKLHLVVSGDPFETPGKSDFLLDVGIHNGSQIQWFPTETIDAGTPPSADNWRTFDYSLEPYAGQTVSLVVKVSYGGPHGVCNDEAFFDEISVK